MTKTLRRHAKPLSPSGQRQPLAVGLDPCCAPCITVLLRVRFPSTISRLVALRVVDPSERDTLRPQTHIAYKSVEAISPSYAHVNAASAVARKVSIIRVGAPALCKPPRRVGAPLLIGVDSVPACAAPPALTSGSPTQVGDSPSALTRAAAYADSLLRRRRHRMQVCNNAKRLHRFTVRPTLFLSGPLWAPQRTHEGEKPMARKKACRYGRKTTGRRGCRKSPKRKK